MSIFTVYGPFGSAVSTNSPLVSETASRVTPVPSLVATTVAPGRTDPDESLTRPMSVAVVTCASKDATGLMMNAAATRKRIRTLRMGSSPE